MPNGLPHLPTSQNTTRFRHCVSSGGVRYGAVSTRPTRTINIGRQDRSRPGLQVLSHGVSGKGAQRASRANHSAEEKTRIVLAGLSGETSIAALCRREGISRSTYNRWSKAFVEAGKRHFAGDPADESEQAGEDSSQTFAMLRDAIDALGEGFVLYDQDDRFVMANRRYREMLAPYQHLMKPGVPVSQITGQALRDGYVTFVARPEGGFTGLLKEIEIGKPLQIEVRFADGSQKIGTLARLKNGGRVTTIVDITERRQVEENARAMMNDIIQSLDEGISLYDSDLKFVMRNSRRYEMMSEGLSELQVGRHLGEVTLEIARTGNILLKDETPEEWSARIVRLTRETAKNIEIPGHDGRLYDLSVHRTKLGGYLLVFKDITQERWAEENRLAAVEDAIQALDEGLVLYDADLNFVLGNRTFANIFHTGPVPYPEPGGSGVATMKHLLDTDFYAIPEGVSRERFLAAIIRNLRNYAKNVPMATTGGRMFSTSVHKPALGGYLISFTDITEQRKAEAELERQREIAHQNEKLSALGELLAGVAHELNNPLSIVVGYAQLLQDNITDPTQKRRVDRLAQAADRCARIVKMFLAMARQRPARIERFSLNETLETALDVVGGGLKAAGVAVKLQLDPELPAINADPDQMAQVFTNLIVNAEHALAGRGEGGVLKLITLYDRASKEVVAKVRDNGAGIPKDIQARIFEPFFTTKDVGHGTGVGLAFSHRIISSHDGRLTIHSAPGKGATFIVRLKAADESVQPADAPQADNESAKARRVLVVDDEVWVTDLIQDILEEHGYRVEARNDARQALELAKAQNFDAILSDMKMPGLDGEAFLSELQLARSDHANKVAFVTGDTMSSRVAEFLKRTASPHLEKPIAPDDLIALVEQLCAADGGE